VKNMTIYDLKKFRPDYIANSFFSKHVDIAKKLNITLSKKCEPYIPD